MIPRFLSRIFLGALLVGTLLTALPVATVHAQAVDPGLNAIGEATGLSATDPRIIATRIINASLGLLAIILTCVILYAGFLWMTAGGDAEQVERAKRMIRNGIIGVIIILCSWGIVTFIINKLLDATGRGEGGVTGGGSGGSGVLEGGAGALGFQVRGISPAGRVPLRNVEVRFTFTRELRESSVAGAIKVLRAADQSPVDGTLRIEGTLVTFTPAAACPAPYADRRCFTGDTEYIARVERSLRSNIGQSLACGGLAPTCEVRFTTGNVVDVTAPTVVIQSPFSGQSVPANDLVRVTTHATDDSGISLIESFADGRSIGTAVPSPSSTSPIFDGVITWDTRGVSTGTHRLFSRALDIDSNRTTSTPVDVMVRPRHCFNLVQDEDETGLNCGGSCGACSGDVCRVGGDCAGGICGPGGRCVEQPVITGVSPMDGRPGTYVTISGVNFGTTTGQVLFAGRTARPPDACAATGASLWTQTQVVVEVPVGATTGTIQIIHRNALSDTTDDERGPRLGAFRISNQMYPGLCAVTPGSAHVGDNTRLDLRGVNLGSSSDRVNFNDRTVDRFLSWTDRSIGLTTPLISPGGYSVQARANGALSNPVSFNLEDRVLSAAPVIDEIQPATGTVGSYITIVGRNFGDRGQVFFYQGTARGVADTRFPAACGNNYWRNGSITVKVPENLQDGLGAMIPVRPGDYQVAVVRDGLSESQRVRFQVVAGAPAPGICGIQPIAGPSGTPITVIGEHFGSSAGRVVFPAVTSTVDAVTSAWGDQSISATVPPRAATGLVRVANGGQLSNGVVFTARNCNEDAGICENGQACCPDGSCSVGGVCRSAARSAQFAWRTSTGRIIRNPAVVESCNASDPPSPSPWGTRAGGNDVCANAQIVILFTTRIEPSTVTVGSGNVLVRRCTGTTGDPCSSGTPAAVSGTLELRSHDVGDYLIFTPSGSGLWTASTTYEVILKKNIRATAADGGLTMVENADRYGTGNAYSFRFRTRQSAELCEAKSVSVSPFNWTMERLGLTRMYGLSARGDDMCVQLNGATMGWAWSVSDGTRATVAAISGRSSDVQNVTGIAPTEAPIQVTTNLVRPAPPAGRPVTGSGNLSIRVEPPRVDAHGPDCDQACINAAVWARFNVTIDSASLSHNEGGVVVPNVIVKRCVNENCRDFDRTLALTPSMLHLEDATVGGQVVTSSLLIVDPGDTLLERERFYKVWVLGGDQGIRSMYGHLPLTGLNDSDPVAFSWKFRVRGGTNPRCVVDRVNVNPGEKYEDYIGARQLFRAQPISAPDACSRDGQILITDHEFTWRTSDARVADFASISGLSGRTALATTMPAHCTDRCLNRGSQGVYGRIAICGDSRVQTTDTHYCRRPSAPGAAIRYCALGDTDCTTPVGTPCTILPPGSVGSEQCDETGDNCTNRCLWAGKAPVREGGTCGNGVVDRGESCDVGSVCVGGTNPGRDCTRDASVCGTGGTCLAAPRRGCSERCLSLGSVAGGSTCGNNDLADGESCDDGNQSNGDGCSSSCLVEGSSAGVTSLCGDGRIDPGESCEMSVAGDADHSTYCFIPVGETTPRCVTGTHFRDLCDVNTCLNLGTVPGRAAGQCGNGTIDAGEDCDGGEGCSARCLKLGSSLSYRVPSICGDRTVGVGEQCDAPTTAPTRISNGQFFQITGLREPTAEERRTNQSRMASQLTANYDERDGRATYGVQCNFTSELSCVSGTGLTRGGCCAPRPTVEMSYPRGNNVCRNTLIYAEFDQAMDHDATARNFMVAKSVAGTSCPVGTTPLDGRPALTEGLRGWLASIWHRIVAFFSADVAYADPLPTTTWCVGNVRGTVEFVEDPDTGKTTANFLLGDALEPNTDYQVILRGETDLTRSPTSTRGIRSARGVVAHGDATWSFRTGSDICTVSSVSVQDAFRAHPFLFYRSNEAHSYSGRAVSLRGGVQVPITPIAGLYSWTWQRWTTQRPEVVRVAESRQIPIQTFATSTAQNKNGSSLVSASLVITADRVSTSTTAGRVYASSRLSTVVLCENPWIPDTISNVSRLPRFEDRDFNFVTTYCRDSGGAGTADDLPSIRVNQVPSSPTDAARGVLRQYLFSFAEPNLRGDGIGVRIVANRLHYSVSDWYLSQGFNGRPQVTNVDGYQALRDGATIYIGAANTDEGLTRADTNIYVISRNPDAGREATSIFDQMVSNLVFNSNLTAQVENVCVNASGAQYVSSQTGSTVYCTADWECLRQDAALHCSSMKEKIQRDLQRISDFQFISRKLEESKAQVGAYPSLATGSQLQAFSTSRWASWQSGLGTAIGQSNLPQDPINTFLTCGRCVGTGSICTQDSDCPNNARCAGVDGRDPATCWSNASSTYACPILSTSNPASASHVYQYRSIGNGDRFELSTELEALGAAEYRPPLLTEAKRCRSGVNGLCQTDADCSPVGGDGRVAPTVPGSCVAAGGRWIYSDMCRGVAFGSGQLCGDGVVNTRATAGHPAEVCELGQTQLAQCSVTGGTGTKVQVCRNDCQGFVDVPGGSCTADTLCGNGRTDTRRCTGGTRAGARYGASCTTDTDCDAGVTCQTVATPEVCDDGALNGTYGHCNRTCSGFGGTCGDNLVSPGESCDLGERNGAYCDTAGSCSDLSATCGADCHSRAPYCGDNTVQSPEQCDGSPAETTTASVCSSGPSAGNTCTTNADCPSGVCGGTSETNSCVGVGAGLCAGGSNDGENCTCSTATIGSTCASDSCGGGGSCVIYRTQRTRTCNNAGITPSADQCRWNAWSTCQPVGQCGDGVVDPGEQCDDGDRDNNDSCTNSCKINVCGDGALNTGVEECDYGTARNGSACTTADYGSTCVACTAQCRMTASSGGYCGDGRRNGSEQCDGRDLGPRATSLSCQSLGFDYAEGQQCTASKYLTRTDGSVLSVGDNVCCATLGGVQVAGVLNRSGSCTAAVRPADAAAGCNVVTLATPRTFTGADAIGCLEGTTRDAISCSRTCGYAGCRMCSDEHGTATISGQVLDAQYSSLGVPSARVTLYQRGIRVSEQFTDSSGRFTFTSMSNREECGQYRVVVDSTRDNPLTPTINEARNGGYWPYESRIFTTATFLSDGIRNSDGKIFLIPRVGRNETLVVHTWDGSLGGRYLLSHLILPANRGYRWSGTPADEGFVSGGSCGTLAADTRPWYEWPCIRDIHEQDNSAGFQGHRDITHVPFARLFCAASLSTGADGGSCFRINTGPQATRYRLQGTVGGTAAGTFVYYLHDQVGARGQSSPDFYRRTKSTVYVVTADRFFTINPPEGNPTRCDGHYWQVFHQDAVTGEIIIPTEASQAYQCGGDTIYGDTTLGNRLPTDRYATVGDPLYGASWLNFGGGVSAINWDMPR
jgi:cysteine-rich repeat protein